MPARRAPNPEERLLTREQVCERLNISLAYFAETVLVEFPWFRRASIDLGGKVQWRASDLSHLIGEIALRRRTNGVTPRGDAARRARRERAAARRAAVQGAA
jgi:hypothetical protein